MSVATAKKIELLSQAEDPRMAILKAVGDLSEQHVFSDLVLVGTFIRNEKTAGGIIRPLENVAEDEFQGKVGLVLKTGPLAYSDHEDDDARGENASIGTWVVYAIKDGWPVQINGTPCRFVPYEKLRMRITDPNLVF
jgi:co-chaperonin GroES (HSP10)